MQQPCLAITFQIGLELPSLDKVKLAAYLFGKAISVTDIIQYGEEYIMNEDNECCHLDCFCGMKDLAEWLGYEIKIMEDDG